MNEATSDDLGAGGDGQRHTVGSPERVGTLVGAAYGLVALASSAAAVVVPTIRDEFSLSLAGAGWVITAFVLALAATAPLYGRFADRVGTRTPVTIGLVVMTVGSIAAAIAPGIETLLTGRVIQGAGAGAIPVLAPAIVAARTTVEQRPRALTRMSGLAAAAAAGLLVGAVIAELAGWRPVIALPAGAIVLIAPTRRLATVAGSGGGRFDVIGAGAVAAITVGVNLSFQTPTTPAVGVIGIVIGAAAAGVAVWSWPRRADPFIPATVLRRRATWQTAIPASSIPAAYFALLIAIPTILTENHDASRILIGMLLVPAALAGAAVGPLARRLSQQRTQLQIAAISLGLAAAGLLVTAVSTGYPLGLAAGFAAVAVSFGLGQAALLTVLSAATPPGERGAALAVFMVVFFAGGGLGGTLLTVIAEASSFAVATAVLATIPLTAALSTTATTSTTH